MKTHLIKLPKNPSKEVIQSWIAVPVSVDNETQRKMDCIAEKWSTLKETLYLSLVPNTSQSMRNGMGTPVDECVKKLKR